MAYVPDFEWSDRMKATARLIRKWYEEVPGMEVGGPLHITTDDQNVEDDSLQFCLMQLISTDGLSAGDVAHGATILLNLAAMSIAERFVVCNEWRQMR